LLSALSMFSHKETPRQTYFNVEVQLQLQNAFESLFGAYG